MRWLVAVLLLVSAAAGYLVSNTRVGAVFVYETVPASLRPVSLLVDTEPVGGVADARAVTQELMNAWNAIPEAQAVFGIASAGGPYNGGTVGVTFGSFTNNSREVAFDDDGQVMAHFGIGPAVLGITLKAVEVSTGRLLDFLCVINVRPGALVAPGSGATTEELFRATLIHELGHTLGLGHTPVGMANTNTFGLSLATASRIPTMFPFRLPVRPQEGVTLQQDDKSALIRSYPAATAGLGSISGSVRALSGAPINEIAVRAIGPAGLGGEHLGVLSNGSGQNTGLFKIENLPPGDYRVLIEAINGRNSVTGEALATGASSLGSNAFEFAVDEYWQPGDTHDPASDDPTAFANVLVRAGTDTGSVDFVLNGEPVFQDQTVNGSLGGSDARVANAAGGFHFADYFVFQASVGQNVTITATSGSVGPQLRLLRPADLSQEDSDQPFFGSTATISKVLEQSGVYTILLSARATTGNPGGTGTYSLTLTGAGSGLPPAPVSSPATVAVGPADPGDLQFGNPVCFLPLLQVRVGAPSHEQLWLDRVTVRSSGSGDDALDVTKVSLVSDLDGDGAWSFGEPILGSGTFSADDGSLAIDTDLALPAGSVHDLLVVYDVVVGSVSSAGPPLWWFLPLAALLPCLRPRRALLLLALALVPLSCGGGGGGGNCNPAFNPAGVVATFRPRIDPGDMLAFTATGGGAPFPLVAATLQSGTLSVSN